MKVLLKTYSSDMNAKIAQRLLKSNGVDSIISPGGGNGATTMDVITGLDTMCQLFIHDKDLEKAKEILDLQD